ncbi:MAG: sugar phosphate nucleotidyltransferase, partial [Desulfofustis sp.]|nr:sugar phosphate nucleotidyltransferase [Desulfofustis sp.]
MLAIQPVILAGGTGSRLWPLSREIYPKQLLCLTGQHSLLQTTLKRVETLPGVLAPVIVVGEEHRFVTRSQAEEVGINGDYAILLEPVGRNTAPAISGAVEFVRRQGAGEDVVILVLPADHLIRDETAFGEAVEEAARRAASGA